MRNDNPNSTAIPDALAYVYIDHSTRSLNLRRKLGHTHAVIRTHNCNSILLTTAEYMQCLKIASVYRDNKISVVPLEFVKERK